MKHTLSVGELNSFEHESIIASSHGKDVSKRLIIKTIVIDNSLESTFVVLIGGRNKQEVCNTYKLSEAIDQYNLI